MEKKMLLLGAVVIVVGLCASSALALDPLGPPIASLDQGQWSLGVEYSYSEMDLERHLISWSSNPKRRAEIRNLHKIYANIGYGIGDKWDGFVRVGGGVADWKAPNRTGRAEPHGNADDIVPVFGGGIRTTFCDQNPELRWGGVIQYSWGKFEGDGTEQGDRCLYEVELAEWQIAAGPTWTPSDGVAVYGGAFLHFVDGEDELHWQGYRPRHHLEEDSWVGGYAGVQVQTADNTALNVEFQSTADAWMLGGNLIWRY